MMCKVMSHKVSPGCGSKVKRRKVVEPLDNRFEALPFRHSPNPNIREEMMKHYQPLRQILLAAVMALSLTALAQELEVGVETIEPGITFVFEGAGPDTIFPENADLAADATDIHLEGRANWADDEAVAVPEGTPRGGFVAYLSISAVVTNEATNESLTIELIPVINLIDNQHYAKNIKLPGALTDTYTVTFSVNPPAADALSFHSDWKEQYDVLFAPQEFSYSGVDFSKR
jgi:periplasmic iron binding protein